MAVPNPNTIQNRRKNRTEYLQWILTFLVGMTIRHIWARTQVIVNFHDTDFEAKALAENALPVQKILTVALSSENTFLSTIRSCIPANNTKCMQYIPPGTNAQRIAVLVPPGEFGRWMISWIVRTVWETFGHEQSEKLQLIPISHIPPYGYGKTHGWTKMIRILPSSLMLGAADAIRSSLDLNQSQTDITLDDLKSSFRMLIRWHCRISHVAAHTSVLTLDMKDFNIDPLVAAKKLVKFVNPSSTDVTQEAELVDITADDDESGNGFLVNGYATGLLTWVQQSSERNVVKELDEVLNEELKLSDNLSAWPCESLWSTGEGGGKPSPMASKLAAKLSPNCTADYTTCVVKKDRCEQAADPICK